MDFEEPCPCEILFEPLRDCAELPNHICLETRKKTCINWLNSHAPGLWSSRIGDYDLCYHSYSGGPHPEAPPRLNNSLRYVDLIVQQWAEVGLKLHQIERLRARHEWAKIQEEVRHIYEKWRRYYEKEGSAIYDMLGIPMDAQAQKQEARSNAKAIARARLIGAGLPATPGMVDFALRQALDPPEVTEAYGNPTAGMLVATFFTHSPVSSHQFGETLWGFDDMIYTMTGSFFGMQDEILAEVGKVAQCHQDWWKSLPHSSLPPGLDKSKPGRPIKSRRAELVKLFQHGVLTYEQIREKALAIEAEEAGCDQLTGEAEKSAIKRITVYFRRKGIEKR